ncbi:MAG TPA: hypothetical protein VFQ77_05170 [Pseudonocardiaceae bacterium]|nr:hypothetical protein [Pseudonocardiaceae bacterium]
MTEQRPTAVHRTLRAEHLGQPVRFVEVAPGLVQTDLIVLKPRDQHSALRLHRS